MSGTDANDNMICHDVDNGGFLLSDSLKTSAEEDEFPVSVVQFFRTFFADASYQRSYREAKGDTQVVIGEWHPAPTSGFIRDVTYTTPVHSSLSPVKIAQATQRQRYHLTPQRMVLEESTSLSGPPYSEYYTLEARFEAVTGRSGPGSCLVRTFAGTHFHKSTMFKGKIDTAATTECRKGHAEWLSSAHQTIARTRPSTGAVATAPHVAHHTQAHTRAVHTAQPVQYAQPVVVAATPVVYVPPPRVVPTVAEPAHNVVTLDLDALAPYAIPIGAGLAALIVLLIVVLNSGLRHWVGDMFFSGGTFYLLMMVGVLYLASERLNAMQARFEEHLKIIEARLLTAGSSHM